MPVVYAILIGSAALSLYIIAGYPMLLMLDIWRKAPPVAKDMAHAPTVTVILAVHNGAAYIRGKIEVLRALDYPKDRLEILVISDGSTDDTAAIAGEYAGPGLKLIALPRGGKAAALNHGISAASGELLFFTDVRQPLDPLALRHLAANFADPTIGAATGEMKLYAGEDGEHEDMGLYWRYEIRIRARHSEIDSLFTTTGCIYAMRRSLAAPIPPDTLTDDAMLALRVFFRGYRVIFDPAALAFDYPAVAGTEFRRRFRTLAGLWQLHARVPKLFTGSNRMRLHFLSHKFGRLLLPWALLAFCAASVALPASRLKNLLLAAELVILLLPAVNRFIPSGSPFKRMTSPARTFLVMNAASLASIAVFFVPPASLWKQTRVQGAARETHPSKV